MEGLKRLQALSLSSEKSNHQTVKETREKHSTLAIYGYCTNTATFNSLIFNENELRSLFFSTLCKWKYKEREKKWTIENSDQ